jgi:hypothetical protein
MSSEVDDDDLLLLDAEELAEGGIARAYEELLPRLRQYVPAPCRSRNYSTTPRGFARAPRRTPTSHRSRGKPTASGGTSRLRDGDTVFVPESTVENGA